MMYSTPTFRRIISLLIILATVSLTGASLILAQSEPATTPTGDTTPEPVTLTCNLDELRQKQAELANLLNNFSQAAGEEAGVALDNLFKVGETYQQLALNCGYIPADIATRPVGTDVTRILNTLPRVFGDPINGQLLYNETYGCAGCHESVSNTAPPLPSTYTRITDIRLHDPALTGYTPEQYIVESIVHPGAYVVEGYQNIMLPNFGGQITLQDLADLIAFLESQDEALPMITPNETVLTGQLTSSSPFILDTFEGKAGDIVLVHLTSTEFDTFVSLLGPDGNELVNNDDDAGTTNSRLGPFLLTTDGSYTVRIDSYDRKSTGNFTLELGHITDCGPAPVAIVTSPTDPINLRGGPDTDFPQIGSAANGECMQVIGRSSSNLWLKVQAVGGRTGWLATSLVETVGDVTAVPTASN